MKVQEDVIVVGGGASGLVTAIMCARKGKRVLVLEHKKQIGKKILATGNGKCNYTNRNCKIDGYRGGQAGFVQYALSVFDSGKAIAFFEELGLYPKEKNGYIYPYSEQASAMVDVLVMELERLSVQIVYEKVVSIQKKNCFLVQTENQLYTATSVVLATGGKASPKLGSDGSGFVLAGKLGHTIVEPVPALIGLRCREPYYEKISGVRIQAGISLYIDQESNPVAMDEGELQLTSYGISGIPVFQVSRFAARALAEGHCVYARMDYMPAVSMEELVSLLKKRFQAPEKSAMEALVGFLPAKLIPVFLQQGGIKVSMSAAKVKEQQLKQLANQLKRQKTEIVETNGFDTAQVTAGGVSTEEIEEKTMESKLVSGLYFTGEIMDVDGICGGYNLQWCWSSAYVASMAISK